MFDKIVPKPLQGTAYTNVVEYGLPAFVLLIFFTLNVFNMCLLGAYLLNELISIEIVLGLAESAGALFNKITIAQFLLLTGIAITLLIGAGWILFLFRYYNFYPGYLARRERYYLTLAQITRKRLQLKSPSVLSRDEAISLGKYSRDIFEKNYPDDIKKRYLEYYVIWVFLMHSTIGLIISSLLSALVFLLSFLLFLNPGDKCYLSWLILWLFLCLIFQVFLAYRSYRATEKRRKMCNDDIYMEIDGNIDVLQGKIATWENHREILYQE